MKNNRTLDWREVAMLLTKNTKMSRREIAKTLDIPRSTCLDHIRKQLS